MTLTVLHVIDGLGAGGAERSLSELLPRFDEAGIRSVVAAFHPGRQGVERSMLEAGRDIRFIPGRPASRVVALRRILRAERPDLVHTTLFAATMTTRLATVGSPARVLTSLVNTPYERTPVEGAPARRMATGAVRTVDRATVGLTDHFHAITAAVRDVAVRGLGIRPERITVIERGRDPARLGSRSPARRRQARAALGLAEDDEVVVGVGRQEVQKGQWSLVEAAGMLASRRPRLVVLLAGRPGGATSRIDQARRNLPPGARVQVLGHRDDVPEVLAAADLFAFPSLREGLGGALIEAMALALPIVASDIPVLREVLDAGGNATLVPPSDPGALAAAIDHLLDRPDLRAAYGARSRERFEERFTLDRCAARMVDLYRAVAEGSAPASGTTSPLRMRRATP